MGKRLGSSQIGAMKRIVTLHSPLYSEEPKTEEVPMSVASHEEWFEMKQVLKARRAMYEKESDFRTYLSPDLGKGVWEVYRASGAR